jgi:tripartite-type tricarboxylate transporter receptor subunit TctC
MATTSSVVINPAFYPNLKYDPIKDFTPVGIVWTSRNVLFGSSEIRSDKDLVALGKKKSLSYGSLGVGTRAHLSAEMLLREAGIKAVHVPFILPSQRDAAAARPDSSRFSEPGVQGMCLLPLMTRFLRLVCLGLLCAATVALAQNAWPSKTVRIVVPFPPGGASTDGMARAFAHELAKELKTPVIVENRPGGGTSVGTLAVKAQPADGHTLLFQADGLFNAKLATPQLAYESSEFEIIAPLAQTNYAFVVPATRGWNRLEDLKGLQRELDVGTLGIGVSSYSMLADRMARHLRIKHRMVPYKGGVEGVTAVIAGDIDGYFATVGLTQTVKDNPKVKVLAYTGSPGRASFIPGVKTFHELGLTDMVFNSYYGLAVRSDTPAPVKAELTRAVRKVVDSAAMKAARQRLHLEEYAGSTDDYRREIARVFKEYEAAVTESAKGGK